MSEVELMILKETFNNSLVGSSKLLHFINPEKYAIWESRVYRYLNNNDDPYTHRVNKPENYLEYLNFIEELKKEKNFDAFYEIMKQKVGYVITGNRALELAFFKGGTN